MLIKKRLIWTFNLFFFNNKSYIFACSLLPLHTEIHKLCMYACMHLFVFVYVWTIHVLPLGGGSELYHHQSAILVSFKRLYSSIWQFWSALPWRHMWLAVFHCIQKHFIKKSLLRIWPLMVCLTGSTTPTSCQDPLLWDKRRDRRGRGASVHHAAGPGDEEDGAEHVRGPRQGSQRQPRLQPRAPGGPREEEVRMLKAPPAAALSNLFLFFFFFTYCMKSHL